VHRPSALLLIVLATAAVAVAACGSREEAQAPPPEPRPAGQPSDFPRSQGRSMASIKAGTGQTLVLAPTVQELRRGTNRFGFALYDTARKPVSGAKVAIYVARQDGTHVRGPYIARWESLKVDGPFQSRTTQADPGAAKAIYVADVPFRKRGRHIVTAMAKLDGRFIGTNPYTVEVDQPGLRPPDVGDRAIRVHTRTLADVGGDAAALDTRTPPATDLLRTDLADVLGRKPVVITFATPALCASRVCGPVVDIVEQAKARVGGDVAFIHQEIYRDNEVNKGIQGPVAAWRLRTEPWTFVIDRRGRVAARFEGAFSVGELMRAIAKVTPRRSSGAER
jgi:hypothetical protein